MNKKAASHFKFTALATAISMASGTAMATACIDPDATQAAGFVVTTLSDTSDCTDGEISLREAVDNANEGHISDRRATRGIKAANGISTPATITFAESITSGQLCLSSPLYVYDELTITGPGRELSLDASCSSKYSPPAKGGSSLIISYAPLTVESITLTEANSSAIQSHDELDLRDVAITNSGNGSDPCATADCASSRVSGRGVVAAESVSKYSKYYGGAVNHQSYADLTITDSTFSGNSAIWYGGAVFSRSKNTEITNSEFSYNSAIFGGAVAVFGTPAEMVDEEGETSLRIEDSSMDQNDAYWYGGALFYNSKGYGGEVVVNHSEITGNEAGYGGAGIHIYGSDASLTVENDCVISGNSLVGSGGGATKYSTFYGGGIDVVAAYLNAESETQGSLVVSDSTISGNIGSGISVTSKYSFAVLPHISIEGSTIEDNGALLGGGISIRSKYALNDIEIDQTTIAGNAAYYGGGVYIQGSSYDPYGTLAEAELAITNSTLSGNSAVWGGGFDLKYFSGVTAIANLSISSAPSTFEEVVDEMNNRLAIQGAAPVLEEVGKPFVISNSTISGNTAVVGGGLMTYSYGEVNLQHSTVAGNEAKYVGGVFGLAPDFTVSHTIVADNSAELLGRDFYAPEFAVEMNYSFIGSDDLMSWEGTGNQTGSDESPIDPMLGNLQNNGGPTLTMLPADTSPVVNAGNKRIHGAPAKDQRGFDRIVNDRIDIGAVETEGEGEPSALEELDSLGYQRKTSGGYTGLAWLVMAPLLLFRRKRQ